MTRNRLTLLLALPLALTPGPKAIGQSSSLYLPENDPAAEPEAVQAPTVRDQPSPLSPAIARASLVAVKLPEPREFAVHDLVTIVVRESVENDSDAQIDTGKDVGIKGEIKEFPSLTLADLAQAQINGGGASGATPKLDVSFSNEFKGDGSYKRTDTFTTRITAQIIDVKPNGNLVLEARKFMQSDKETIHLVLSGTCRAEDVAGDNTVLSTQLFDLRLLKEHAGELHKATRKGVLTRLLEGVFNF